MGIQTFASLRANDDKAGQLRPIAETKATIFRNGRPPVVEWLTIGDMARYFSITLRALRFYESKGLVKPLRQGAQRLYSPTDKARISLILSAKELGFTLTEIAGMLDVQDGKHALTIGPELLLRQINFMERQHGAIETALAALRMRYYAMTENTQAEAPAV
jgi:DNA-binding transcriptional MerR regulator